jgi:hypothetical protein
MSEEDMTTKDDNGIIKALENAIVFFDIFCLMEDFEAHAMDDEPNVPGAEANPETIITIMPVPTKNKMTMNIPPMHWLLKILCPQ